MPLRDYNAAVDFVDRNVAEGRGDKIAFIDPSRSLSYGELRDAAARVGPMLARLGVEQENRIALVLHDTVEFPILFWGAIRAGVVPVLLNTRLTADQYRYLLEDSRSKAVFVSTDLLPVIEEAAAELPHLRSIVAVGDGPSATRAIGRSSGGRKRRRRAGAHLRRRRRLLAVFVGHHGHAQGRHARPLQPAHSLATMSACVASAIARTTSCSRRRNCSSPMGSATRCSARCGWARRRCCTRNGRRPNPCSTCCGRISRPCCSRCRRSMPRSSPTSAGKDEQLPDRLRLCVSAGEPLARAGRIELAKPVSGGTSSTASARPRWAICS